MASFLIFLYLFLLPSAHADEPPLPESCQTKCVSPFGAELGKTTEGIIAYSNCQAHCVNPAPVEKDGTFLGIKWQCVEFARRWLYTEFGMVFPSIDFAWEIWGKVDHLVLVKEKKNIPLLSFVNGALAIPQRGDLLIYGQDLEGTGHVAIVLRVDKNKKVIYVGEENLKNIRWPGNYARSIPFVRRDGHYWLLDAYLVGWKHPSAD